MCCTKSNTRLLEEAAEAIGHQRHDRAIALALLAIAQEMRHNRRNRTHDELPY